MTQTVAGVVPAEAAAGLRRPEAAAGLYVQRERFIAVSRNALIRALSAPESWPGSTAAEIGACFNYMSQWRHLSYGRRERDLIDTYLAFNPDREIAMSGIEAGAGTGTQKQRFLESVRWLLERANFDEVPRDNLEAIIDESNPYGLDLEVDLTEFEDIIVSVRGEKTETVRPDLFNRLLGKKPIEAVILRRVFILFTLKRLQDRVKDVMIAERVDEAKARKIMAKRRQMLPPDVDDTHIYVKIFKNVPRTDIEIMFPNTRVLLRTADKLRIGASASGGIGMGVASLIFKAVMAALSPIGVLLAVFGLVGGASQQLGQVVSRRTRYMLKMTRHLHFQNISSNQGALAFLIERAEEEDIKEEVLLYALLAKASIRRSELGEAKTAIEAFLNDHFQVHAQFDVEDALERLIATGLVHEQADGVITALPPAAVSRHIADLWRGYLGDPAGTSMAGQNGQF